ncbi:hypothetical protein ACFSX9_04945 [Flavobacterium ardleyense]|uniref:Uncharacterized protein n=1 Tax=Flavobacterium ardleyense TaxID=2038737 RepID=A0ABW5Z6N3_9FLAO
MSTTYPNPWDFKNTYKKLASATALHQVVYYDLNEIGMSGPLGGKCFIENSKGLKIKLNYWCAGPPVWETSGKLVAIPIWTNHEFKGIIQHIGLFNIETSVLKIFSKSFTLLDLRSFEQGIIQGFDSPLYKTKTVNFDIESERISQIISLKQ